MFQKKRDKYESRRQMLYELSKDEQLQGLAQDVLSQLSELKQLFASYETSQLELETQQIMGDDPLMKGKKLMKLLSNQNQKNVDYRKKAREILILMYAKGQVFPQIVSYLIPDESGISLKYNFELETDLLKINSLKNENKSETYKKLENGSDQALILVHLILLNQVIQQRSCFQQFYSQESDCNIIKSLYEGCQIIDPNNKSKIIESIILQISTLYNQSIKQPKKERKSEKISHLIFRVLLQLLLQKNIIIPELLKIMKLIRFSKVEDVKYVLGKIVFRPSIKLLSQMCLMNKIQSESKLLQLGLASWSNLPKYETFKQVVAIHFPELLYSTQDQVMEQYLEQLTRAWKMHHKTLLLIFKDDQFQSMLKEIHKICGQQIKYVRTNKEVEQSEYLEFGANSLKIGTMLFKLQELVLTHIVEEDIPNHSICKLTGLFLGFLQSLNFKKEAFPYILTYLQFKNNKLELYISESTKQQLRQIKAFQQYLQKQDLSYEVKQSNEEEIIFNQIYLLYNHKEVLAKEIKEQQQICESLVKELQNAEIKIKEYLVRILVFTQYQISI